MAYNNNLKRVIFGGDSNVGKTTFFMTHFLDYHEPQYIPIKVEDYITKEYTVGTEGEKVEVLFVDHEGGGEDWHRLRHLGYTYYFTSVIVLCFSISSIDTFERIEEYWYPFAQKHCPTAKLVLLGMKKDLMNDEKILKELAKANEVPVAYEQGVEMAKRIGAVGYYECSSKLKEGFDEVCKAAAEAAFLVSSPTEKKKKCFLM